MTLSATTSWTNKTLDVLRGHAAERGIPKRLCDGTVRDGVRMLSRQRKATEGVRHLRLDAWYYIRKITVSDIIAVLNDNEEELRPAIRHAMSQQAVYHVVIRGNDPRFMPPRTIGGIDIVTTYFCECMQEVHDHVDTYLFDNLESPADIKDAMDDPAFDGMLEAYLNSGDLYTDRSLHLVSRLRGGSNILHTCIKENYLDTLRVLLEDYTKESHEKTPWRVLAEPLRQTGKYHLSAFHRAVYDGRTECLAELLAWARKNGHDTLIAGLHSIETWSSTGEPLQQLTCLDLAAQEKNYECYNLLAEYFGEPPHPDLGATNQQLREVRRAARAVPRIEVSKAASRCSPVEILASKEVQEPSWIVVLHDLEEVLENVLAGTTIASEIGNGRAYVYVKLIHIEFSDDADLALSNKLFAIASRLAACETLAAEHCVVKTDRTLVNLLSALVQRLGTGQQVPAWAHLSSRTACSLEPDMETECDLEATKLLREFVSHAPRRPTFLGAHNCVISMAQRDRLKRSSASYDGPLAWVATYCCRIAVFVTFAEDCDDDDDIEAWKQRMELMPLARAVHDMFYSTDALLGKEYADPRDALDPNVTTFIELTLASWFTHAKDEADAWRQWAGRLGVDEDILLYKLAPALDSVLETLLRMHSILDHAWGKRPGGGSIAATVRKFVPAKILQRLPLTERELPKEVGPNRLASCGRGSLLATGGVSLRPAWAK